MKLLLALFALTLSHAGLAETQLTYDLTTPIREHLVLDDNKSDKAIDYDRVHLRNDCHETIGVFLVFKKLDGQWDTSPGAYQVNPGATVYVANTRNAVYYVAAASASGRYVWKGTKNIQLDDGSVIPMIETKITTTGYGDWTQVFYCN